MIQTFDDYQLYIGDDSSNHFSGPSSDMNIAFGRGGNDQLSGASMDDDLIGGAGNDVLTGGRAPITSSAVPAMID